RLQLQWIAEGGSQAGGPAPVAARRRSRERLAWGLAAAGVAAAAIPGLLLWLPPRQGGSLLRFRISAPPGQSHLHWPRISPNGKLLAFLATDSAGTSRIWLRVLDALDAHPIPGTEGAARPFWSPDSRYLAFIAEGRLKKVPVGGGPASVISEASGR